MKKKILILLLLLPLLTGCLPKQKQAQTEEEGQIIAQKVESLPEELTNFIFSTDHLVYENCGQTQGLSASDYQFNAASIDLNQDSQPEYIVEPFEVCDQMVRGASGNGLIMVYQKNNSGWQEIGVLEGNSYTILKEKTNGHYDLQTAWYDSASSYYVSLYQAQKEEVLGIWYKLIKQELTSAQRD